MTTRPVMVRALIMAHEPRQARVAGEAYVSLTLRAGGMNINHSLKHETNMASLSKALI